MRTIALFTLAAIAGLAEARERPPQLRAASTDAGRIIDSAFATIGGRAALRALRGVQVAYVEARFTLGQGPWVGAPSSFGSAIDGTEVRNYEHPSVLTRYRVGGSRQAYTRLLQDDSAEIYIDTLATGFGGFAPRKGYVVILHDDPIWLLRQIARAEDNAMRVLLAQSVLGRAAQGVEVRLDDDTLRIWFDARSRQPLSIDRLQDDPIDGTRLTRIALGAWQSVGALSLPRSVIVTSNGAVTLAENIASIQADPPADSMFATIKKRASVVANVAPPNLVPLAPGVFRLEGTPLNAGAPYNPVVAEQGDSLIIFDPPMSDAYTRAILDTLRLRFPRERARTFVVSHHHIDHVGGVRAAFVAGLSGIAPNEIADYVRGLGLPEGQRVPATRHVTAVRDTLAVGSGPSRFVLYHIPNHHAEGLMMAYFPEAKLLAEVDLAAGTPRDQVDLYTFLHDHGLVVERLARMHGDVMPWPQFEQRALRYKALLTPK